MTEWIKVEDRLPNLEGLPDYNCQQCVIAVFRNQVRPMYYARQMYNKTEKGREPRWEDMHGRIASAPTHWQPLPNLPDDVCPF